MRNVLTYQDMSSDVMFVEIYVLIVYVIKIHPYTHAYIPAYTHKYFHTCTTKKTCKAPLLSVASGLDRKIHLVLDVSFNIMTSYQSG